jgi:MFS family permease
MVRDYQVHSAAVSPRNQLTWLSLAMLLGMTLWFSATAANGQIAREFALTSGQTAWVTMAVQAGFVAGTLISALLNLPDVLSARRLFHVGCLVGAGANAGLALATGPASIIGLRLATGAALACVYPPGMKVAAGWYERRRGAALGVLIGALTVGSALPHLLAASSAAVPWRVLVLLASALAVIGGGIVIVFVRDGPYVASVARFDPSAAGRIFRDRETRLATLGYLGHMWELYAMWTWIAAFASASVGPGPGPGVGAAGFGALGAAVVSPRGSAVAFAAIGSGAAGSVAAGLFADRIGKARVAEWALMASAVCCAVAGFVFKAPPAVLFLFAAVWGVAVVADSAQLSALVAEYSPRNYVGTALTIQTSAGFLLTMASIRLLPIVAQAIGWQWVFLCLVPGPVLGALAMARLMRGVLDLPLAR